MLLIRSTASFCAFCSRTTQANARSKDTEKERSIATVEPLSAAVKTPARTVTERTNTIAFLQLFRSSTSHQEFSRWQWILERSGSLGMSWGGYQSTRSSVLRLRRSSLASRAMRSSVGLGMLLCRGHGRSSTKQSNDSCIAAASSFDLPSPSVRKHWLMNQVIATIALDSAA